MTERRPTGTRRIDRVLQRVRRHCEQNAGQLRPEELERLSEIVLRIAGDDPEYPWRWDTERCAREIHSLDDPDDPVAREIYARPRPMTATGGTLQALIARLLVAANLVSRGQREVARLYLWGLTTAQIAQKLGIPRTTVQSRWRCARKHLRAALREVSPSDWLLMPSPSGRVESEQARAIFSREEHRTLYCAPRHCPQGRSAAR